MTCEKYFPSSPPEVPRSRFLRAAICVLTLGMIDECATETCKATISWTSPSWTAPVENEALKPEIRPADLGDVIAVVTPDLYARL